MRPAAHRARGFSLIELLVTLAVLAIVTSVAVGSYRQYVQRAARVDATSALLRVAAAQEKFYAQNGQYAGNDILATPPPFGLGIAGTERGYYELSIDAAAGGLAIGYTATATADAGSGQADDDDCQAFTINERGLRTASNDEGATSAEITNRCWR